MISFGGLLFFGVLVALANVLGGLLLARPRSTTLRDAHFLRYLIALGAGSCWRDLFRDWAEVGGCVWGETEIIMAVRSDDAAGRSLLSIF